jgi:hypothetical protein
VVRAKPSLPAAYIRSTTPYVLRTTYVLILVVVRHQYSYTQPTHMWPSDCDGAHGAFISSRIPDTLVGQ